MQGPYLSGQYFHCLGDSFLFFLPVPIVLKKLCPILEEEFRVDVEREREREREHKVVAERLPCALRCQDSPPQRNHRPCLMTRLTSTLSSSQFSASSPAATARMASQFVLTLSFLSCRYFNTRIPRRAVRAALADNSGSVCMDDMAVGITTFICTKNSMVCNEFQRASKPNESHNKYEGHVNVARILKQHDAIFHHMHVVPTRK